MGVTVLTHVENAKWGLADLGNEGRLSPRSFVPLRPSLLAGVSI